MYQSTVIKEDNPHHEQVKVHLEWKTGLTLKNKIDNKLFTLGGGGC